MTDFEELSEDDPQELDVRELGFQEELPAEGLDSLDGFSGIIQIPPDLFETEVKWLAVRIVRSVLRLEPARTPLMKAVYRMFARLADAGISATPAALTLGLLLGVAKVHRVPIRTHPRDLAKDVKTRYRDLLAIRRAAIAELRRMGPDEFRVNLPD